MWSLLQFKTNNPKFGCVFLGQHINMVILHTKNNKLSGNNESEKGTRGQNASFKYSKWSHERKSRHVFAH